MTSPMQSFAHLSDDELLATVKRLATTECRATAALVRSLMELDVRRLYLGEGYSSLFTYCTQALHLAEGAAYNRIEAARAARRFPRSSRRSRTGSVTLTTVRLLAPHLTAANHQDVLASARHKGKREVEQLVASLRPLPPVPSTIRKLPDPDRSCWTRTPSHPRQWPRHRARQWPRRRSGWRRDRWRLPWRRSATNCSSRSRARRTRSSAACRRSARHVIPSGDPAEIFDRALTLLLQDLERRRCAAVTSPRAAREAVGGSRHIPASVKREVWRRDDGRCAYTGRDGRCRERSFLEYHHVQPYAAGGAATAANIELRCRAHNVYEASLFFKPEGEHVVEIPAT